MNKKIKFIITFAAVLSFIFSISISSVFAISVGSKISTVKIKDANDNPAWIPGFGKKVISIFYTDPDVADQNDPFADLLKAAKLDKNKYLGIGIGNLDDTWKPNAIIRMVIRRKIAKYKATILTDTDKTLQKVWKLGNCNEKSVIIIIGKDKKVYYYKKGAMNAGERNKALKIIKDLMKK